MELTSTALYLTEHKINVFGIFIPIAPCNTPGDSRTNEKTGIRIEELVVKQAAPGMVGLTG